jgi:hypothetical protein
LADGLQSELRLQQLLVFLIKRKNQEINPDYNAAIPKAAFLCMGQRNKNIPL